MKKKMALLKSKAGMTFVELLTALALLVIIITSFTPMLLNSYETLYKAGEINEKTYISKTAVEENLAIRDSEHIENFMLNFEDLGKTMFIKMRAALTDIQNNPKIQSGIQTFYYGGNGYIKIISPTIIPDNEPLKEVVVQFKGIKVDAVNPGGESEAKYVPSEDKYYCGIEVIVPDTKGGTSVSEGELFDPANCLGSGEYSVAMDGENQIKIQIYESVDVVSSVIQINAHYIDENRNKNVTSAYVKITPANIMLAGETSAAGDAAKSVPVKDENGNVLHSATIPYVSYYTSAGVIPQKNDAGVVTGLSFEIYPRALSTLNTPDLVGYSNNHNLPYPSGTVFSTIKWIDNDDSLYLGPYYVMAGNNGVIQRLFVSNGPVSDAATITGKRLSQATYVDGGITKTFSPTFWGGDRSHQFGYASSRNRPSYKYGSWYTASDGVGSAHYDMYASQTRYSYYFNGQGIDFDYETMNGRRVSYVLTEYGWAHRLIGSLEKDEYFRDDYEDVYKSYYMAWEHPQTRLESGKAHRDVSGGRGVGHHQVVGYAGGSSSDADDAHLSYIRIKQLNTHGYKSSGGADYMFSISYPGNWDNTYDTVHHICYSGCGCAYDGDSSLANDSRQDVATNINITDFYYDEATGKMTYIGTVNAYGTLAQSDNVKGTKGYLHSYEKPHKLKEKYGGSNDTRGGTTGYFIESNTDREGVTIYKICTERNGDYDANVKVMFQTLKGLPVGDNPLNLGSWSGKVIDLGSWESTLGSPINANTDARVKFFAERTYNDKNYKKWNDPGTNQFFKIQLTDVKFTMGYSSNREKMYSNITWDGANEQYRSYEPYYFWSHYGNQHMYPGVQDDERKHTYNLNSYTVENNSSKVSVDDFPDLLSSSGDKGYWYTNKRWVNSINNDYYNIWFPGEMYNLTKTATLDGVTVAVGYAVSGSTFQFNFMGDDVNNLGNTSTALGSIYNDGVLSATLGNASATDAMVNLLYYKDATQFDYSSLTTRYNNQYTYLAQQTTQSKDSDGLGADGYNKYGTHSRLSVQFTAVDLVAQVKKLTGDNKAGTARKEYFAVYGDNHGRIFYSKVAETDSTYSFDSEGNQITSPDTSSTKLVEGIRDLSPANEAETRPQSNWGQMVELTQAFTNSSTAKSFSEYYSEINNIYILDDEIYIVGKSASNNEVIVFVGKMQTDENGNITDFPRPGTDWRKLDLTSGLGSGSYVVHDMMMLGGYIYAAGEKVGGGGFCVAVNELYIDAQFGTADEKAKAETDYPKISKNLDYKIYSIAGYSQ